MHKDFITDFKKAYETKNKADIAHLQRLYFHETSDGTLELYNEFLNLLFHEEINENYIEFLTKIGENDIRGYGKTEILIDLYEKIINDSDFLIFYQKYLKNNLNKIKFLENESDDVLNKVLADCIILFKDLNPHKFL